MRAVADTRVQIGAAVWPAHQANAPWESGKMLFCMHGMAGGGGAGTWQNMWQGGSAMLGSAAGFHADSTMRRSSGLFLGGTRGIMSRLMKPRLAAVTAGVIMAHSTPESCTHRRHLILWMTSASWSTPCPA